MSQPPQDEIHLRVTHAKAARWIRDEIEAGLQLKVKTGFMGTPSRADMTAAVDAGNEWIDRVRRMLRNAFDWPKLQETWREASFDSALTAKDNLTALGLFKRARDSHAARLRDVLKQSRYMDVALANQSSQQENASEGAEREVFVVHGHDEAAREAVARCLMKLQLEPIILEDEPSGGKTIIEKLEAAFDVDFAVVILTPDDVGAAKDQAEHFRPRARQNVILELGYAMGLLGRGRVCALYRAGVELPSDYQGVVYISLDSAGAWKLALARELRDAGFDVDLNKA